MKNPTWLYQKSVMALGGVRHGSVKNLSWLLEESVPSRDCLIFRILKTQKQDKTNVKKFFVKNNNTQNLLSKVYTKVNC